MHIDLDIHNYYEHLVMEEMYEQGMYDRYDADFIADLSCLALSQLPARYIRHDVDMAFYLSSQQRAVMQKEVIEAVSTSAKYLAKKLGTANALP